MKTNIVRELKRIAADNGGILQPEIVVAEARPATSPLHSKFEWDNTKAAQQYRIWQARQLIRVTVETIPGLRDKVNVFVSLTPDRETDGGGYRITTDVLSDKEMKEQMLRDAMEELEVFRRKYSRIRELTVVFKAIAKIRPKKKAR